MKEPIGMMCAALSGSSVAAIGVDGDQAFLGRDRAARRRDPDLAAAGRDAGRRRVLEQLRAGLRRHPRRADHQLHRMDVAGAGVAHAAEIMRRAEPLGRLLGASMKVMCG